MDDVHLGIQGALPNTTVMSEFRTIEDHDPDKDEQPLAPNPAFKNGRVSVEEQLANVVQVDEIDAKMGFARYTDTLSKLGWLVNMQSVSAANQRLLSTMGRVQRAGRPLISTFSKTTANLSKQLSCTSHIFISSAR